MKHTLTIENSRFDYLQFGNGEPFVILPGVSLKPVMASSEIIESSYADFAQKYTVYLFDRRTPLTSGFTVLQMAEDVANAMEKLGIANARVLGVSQGGMIAQCLATRHPELVQKLVLASTLVKQNDVSSATFSEWAYLAQKGEPCALNHHVFTHVYSPEYYKRYPKAFERLEKDGSAEEIARFEILAQACASFDYDKNLNVVCPTLVVGGENDDVLSVEGSKQLAQKLGCELVVFKGASHAVYDEEQLFKKCVYDFFAN